MPAACLAIADLRLAAWFLWMTPLLTALSSLRQALRISALAFSTSPVSEASRNLRIAVLSSDLTALLRRRAFSFCLLRLIWDLMFATTKSLSLGSRWDMDERGRCAVCTLGTTQRHTQSHRLSIAEGDPQTSGRPGPAPVTPGGHRTVPSVLVRGGPWH